MFIKPNKANINKLQYLEMCPREFKIRLPPAHAVTGSHIPVISLMGLNNEMTEAWLNDSVCVWNDGEGWQ